MRVFIFLIMAVCFVSPGWAGEDVSEEAPVKSGRVEVEEDGAKKIYAEHGYTVDEETKIVEKALDVFKKKAGRTSLYEKKFRIYDAVNPHNQSFLSFMTNDQNAGIVFSPDDDFVYYVEVEEDGSRRLRGYGIESHARFSVSDDVDRFFIETCEDAGVSYLVVLGREDNGSYSVYDLNGGSVVLPDMPADIDDLKSFICY